MAAEDYGAAKKKKKKKKGDGRSPMLRSASILPS